MSSELILVNKHVQISSIPTPKTSNMANECGRKRRHSGSEEDARSVDKKAKMMNLMPVEMIDMILEKLLETDPGLNASLVCRQWHDVISRRRTFKGTLSDETIQSFVDLNPNIPFKSLNLTRLVHTRVRVVSRIRTPTLGNYHSKLFQRSVEHLVVGGDAGIFLKMPQGELPYSLSTGFAEEHTILQNIYESMRAPDLRNILSQLMGVKTLSISSIAFLSVPLTSMKTLEFSRFSALTTLDICIGKRTEIVKMSAFLSNTTFTNLANLFIRVYFSCLHFSIYICLLKFIGKHHQSLKKLSFIQAQAFYAVPKVEVFNSEFRVDNYPHLRDNLMEIKLEYLRLDCIIFGHPLSIPWKALEQEFIRNQTKLRSLELSVTLRNMNFRLDQLIPACEETLERLEVSANHFRPNKFDCTTLQRYKNLKHCHLFLSNPLADTRTSFSVEIANIDMFPSSIVDLHLGPLPCIADVRILGNKLPNLEKISYGSNGEETYLNPGEFLHQLMEHLRFPKLAEFRLYQFSCPVVLDILNDYAGIFCYNEDGDTFVVIVDRSRFDFRKISKSIFVSMRLVSNDVVVAL